MTSSGCGDGIDDRIGVLIEVSRNLLLLTNIIKQIINIVKYIERWYIYGIIILIFIVKV
jgi:hypothetical protein